MLSSPANFNKYWRGFGITLCELSIEKKDFHLDSIHDPKSQRQGHLELSYESLWAYTSKTVYYISNASKMIENDENKFNWVLP